MDRVTVTFSANKIETEKTEYGVLILRVRSDNHYLTIQRKEDRNPGAFGDIHFECDGQGYGAYDVMKSIRLEENQLRVELFDSAQDDFDGRLIYEVNLCVEEIECSRIAEFLNRMIEPTETLNRWKFQQDADLNG